MRRENIIPALCFAVASFFAVLIITATPKAKGQEQPNYRERALELKLSQEISGGLQCTSDALQLRDRVAVLEKQLEALKPSQDMTD